MGELVIGKYIRLSLADRDLMKKENKTESESISHQRDLIQHYIDADPELSQCRQEEFFDDGFSGTKFDRPSFERLIDKIKVGEINCVIVKDFSRFGRDYIELGDYLERIFPFLGVRFISINDHYDSNDYKGTTGGLDVVMKNIVYDFYSKDLSIKVKTAKMSKMKQGKYLGGHVPYGLRRHDTIKGKLAIDEEAAEIVRRIFGYALEGKTCSMIARELNQEGVETPAQYYRRKHPDQKKYKRQSEQAAWTANAVRNIIKQEMYYGAVAGHRREKVVACSRATKAVPAEKQIIVEGQHEAIVSKDEWLRAQGVIRSMKSPVRIGGRDYPLKGIARCGCCGRKLMLRSKRKEQCFICVGSVNDPNTSCYTAPILEEPLNEAVWSAIRNIFSLEGKVERMVKASKEMDAETALVSVKQIGTLQRELDGLNDKRLSNIELLNLGEISKEEYLSRRDALTMQEEDLKQQILMYQMKKDAADTGEDPDVKRFLDSCKVYRNQEKMSNNMVRAFVEKVMVYDQERIEIVWNFSDRIIDMM